MRYGVPRSVSPSPVRGKQRSPFTFGLQSDEDYDSDLDSHSDSSSDSLESVQSTTSSSSSDSFCYASETDVPKPLPKPPHGVHSAEEVQRMEDTVAAIRLRTRHHDPYEDWERQTRMDAFRTARKQLNATQTQLHDRQDRVRSAEMEHRAALNAKQMEEVRMRLEQMRVMFKTEEDKLRESHKARERRVWDRIEGVIKLEEEKKKAYMEAERRVKEEEEQRRKEEEKARLMLEEEKQKKRKEEEEKQKEEEEKKRKEEEEAQRQREERKRKELEEQQVALLRVEREEGEKDRRKALGVTTAKDDWSTGRTLLQDLKLVMKDVKSDRQAKAEWSKGRRQFTSKIGQITDDVSEINRISTQLYQVMHPPNAPAHSPPIHQALLSSLSKAILLQAETEVTAEKKSAKPLAQVTFNLLDTIDGFAEIFFAKLVQRTGGWPIPIIVPLQDTNSKPWESQIARSKAMGYRFTKGNNGQDVIESNTDYSTRIFGIMRVYLQILKITPQRRPLKSVFQLPRYWIWVSRILGERDLLETAIAAQLIYIALEVMGSHARSLWGHQWDKILELVYDGVTVGIPGGSYIGGSNPEGIAARVRVQLEIEKIMRMG